jgi:hypothetical protein
MAAISPLANRTIRALLLVLLLTVPGAQLAAAEPNAFGVPEKFSYYVHRTYSWQRMAWLGVDAGFDYVTGGAQGIDELLRGYGDGFGRRVVRNSTEFALGAAFHEDSRYRVLGRGSLGRRLRYATVRAFQASGPDLRMSPAYSRFAAFAAGELMPSLWSAEHPAPSGALCGIGFGILGQIQNNYLAEFSPELKRFGHNIGRKLRRKR